jgi:hypothetical protein
LPLLSLNLLFIKFGGEKKGCHGMRECTFTRGVFQAYVNGGIHNKALSLHPRIL